jgi:hypothetical protein
LSHKSLAASTSSHALSLNGAFTRGNFARSAANYVFKPTAGDGLQSFRLLPAGSGLTRR